MALCSLAEARSDRRCCASLPLGIKYLRESQIPNNLFFVFIKEDAK